tara:strand:- start:6562 stop:6879 length:318 start_codon:yes stop_codon:yes gene_type:complete
MSTKLTIEFPNGSKQEIEAESLILISFEKENPEDDPQKDGVAVRGYEFPQSTGWGKLEAVDMLGNMMQQDTHQGYQMVGRAVCLTLEQGREVLKSMAKELAKDDN